MPFDGTEAKFVKPEVFSLEGLVAWLETQDPATTFDYASNHDCVLCRYFTSAGMTVKTMNPYRFVDAYGKHHELSEAFRYVPHGNSKEPMSQRTYRGVMVRIRQLLATA